MADSQSTYSQYPVHLGSWVNWSRGKVFGATLTMTRENGNLLIAFTAVFIGFVSSRFWYIISFVLHRLFSSPEPRDGLHHQRQVILRNASSPELSAWTMTLLLLAWRRSARRPCVRIFPILIGAFVCIVVFALAGGFSSQIATAIGDEVLIASGNQCVSAGSDPDSELGFSLYDMESEALIGSDAANYAQQCYRDSGDGVSGVANMFDCESFVVSRLPTKIDDAAPCPFPTHTICKSPSNIHLDTGYLNSHDHFGLNSPPETRMLARQTYACAPLQTRGYTRQRTSPHFDFTQYWYGERGWDEYSKSRIDFTHESLGLAMQYPNRSEFSGHQVPRSKGSLQYFFSKATNGTTDPVSEFLPRSELFRPDADMSIVFFSGNGLLYESKSTDDWYSATSPCENLTSNNGGQHSNQNIQAYCPDEPAAPLGCITQYQFCKPSLQAGGSPKCGLLGSLSDAVIDAYPLFDVPKEVLDNTDRPTDILTGADFSMMAKLYTRFWMAWFPSWNNDPGSLLLWAGPDLVLLSSQTVSGGVQMESRDDQWKRDVAHWWSIFLARQQITFTEIGLPLTYNLTSDSHVEVSNLPDYLCGNQKIRSRRHTSFSIFGICFIYVVGGLITIISYMLEPLFICIDKRKDKLCTTKSEAPAPHYRKDVEWTANDVLHLHCLSNKPLVSHQDQGEGLNDSVPARWTKFEDAIPIIEPAGHLMEPLRFDGDKNSQQPKEKTKQPQNSLTLVNEEGQQTEHTSPGSEATSHTATGTEEPDQGQHQHENQSTPPHTTVNDLTENHLEIPTLDATASGQVGEVVLVGEVIEQQPHAGNETGAAGNEHEHEHVPQLPALVLQNAGEGRGSRGLSNGISKTRHSTGA